MLYDTSNKSLTMSSKSDFLSESKKPAVCFNKIGISVTCGMIKKKRILFALKNYLFIRNANGLGRVPCGESGLLRVTELHCS